MKTSIFNLVGDKAQIKISAGVKEIHPVMESLTETIFPSPFHSLFSNLTGNDRYIGIR